MQSLTVWLTPVGFSTSSPALEICQITAIRIDKSHGRNMTFHASQTQPLSPGDRIDQYQCDLGEDMMALSWILNAKADLLRAVFSETTHPTQTMIPEISAP